MFSWPGATLAFLLSPQSSVLSTQSLLFLTPDTRNLFFSAHIFFKIGYNGFDAGEPIDSGNGDHRIALVYER